MNEGGAIHMLSNTVYTIVIVVYPDLLGTMKVPHGGFHFAGIRLSVIR